MCNAISIVMSADSWWGPSHDGWDHSHSSIMKANNLPESTMGTKYARVEVTPDNGKFRDDNGAVVKSLEGFCVILDEQRKPGWWIEDEPAQIERAKSIAGKWLRSHPDNLVPGFVATGGDGSTLTGGNYSTLTGGDDSTLTGGNNAILCWKKWDGVRYRLHVVYVGDGGTLPNVAYKLGKDCKPEAVNR